MYVCRYVWSYASVCVCVCLWVYVCLCTLYDSLRFTLSRNFPGYIENFKKDKEDVEVLPVRMRYHKEEVAHVGTESVYVKHCRATRCAFVKPSTDKGVTKDLMYVYQPQGLDRQAGEMGTLLARFQSRNLASCFLEALETKLNMKFMEVYAIHGTSCNVCKMWYAH